MHNKKSLKNMQITRDFKLDNNSEQKNKIA